MARIDDLPTRNLMRSVIAAVADELGNTIAVCRRCYIHPFVIAEFEAGRLKLHIPHRGRNGLSAAECAVLAFLRKANDWSSG